jgi:hypothetical protein
MEVEDATGKERRPASTRKRLFTVASANEALVLVRKVVEDVVHAYAELMRLRDERQELTLEVGVDARLEDLHSRIERRADQLRQLHQELADVGCELKDCARGLIDFPALRQGREVLLCWQLGEPNVAYWHDPKAGFAGRRPIDTEFPSSASEAPALGAGEPETR